MTYQAILPNLLTLTRLGLSPVIVGILLQNPPSFFLALLLFTLASLSDLFDGFLARTWGQESAWGAWLDPMADKVLLTSVFGVLGWIDVIPWSLVLLAFVRDAAIVAGVLILKVCGKVLTIQPLFISKLNTVLQMLLIGLSLILGAWGVGLAEMRELFFFQGFILFTFITTGLSGLAYGYLGWRLWQNSTSRD